MFRKKFVLHVAFDIIQILKHVRAMTYVGNKFEFTAGNGNDALTHAENSILPSDLCSGIHYYFNKCLEKYYTFLSFS